MVKLDNLGMLMSKVTPFWFTPQELETLRNFLSQEELVCEYLEELRLETDVAEIRVSLLSINTISLSHALGYQTGAIPIYLTELEKTALLNCLNLPVTTREVLV